MVSSSSFVPLQIVRKGPSIIKCGPRGYLCLVVSLAFFFFFLRMTLEKKYRKRKFSKMNDCVTCH